MVQPVHRKQETPQGDEEAEGRQDDHEDHAGSIAGEGTRRDRRHAETSRRSLSTTARRSRLHAPGLHGVIRAATGEIGSPLHGNEGVTDLSATMGEPVTQGQFFQAMQDADVKGQERHTRIRESMEDGFRRLEQKLDTHSAEDAAVADRVSRLEEREKSRDQESIRRSTWVALLLSLPSAVAALYALLHQAGR